MSEDLGNELHIEQRKKKVNKVREEELQDLRKVLETGPGRRVLWRILEESKMMAPDLFTGNSQTFHNLGKRDLGMWIYQEIIDANPNKFVEMMVANAKPKE